MIVTTLRCSTCIITIIQGKHANLTACLAREGDVTTGTLSPPKAKGLVEKGFNLTHVN